MNHPTDFAPLPTGVRLFLLPLPLPPLGLLLRQMAKSVGRRQPGLFARLGVHTEKVFLLDPTDLPFVFRLEPRRDHPHIESCRREVAGAWDVRIAGTLGALLGLVHGAADGDALFFSRDIIIEGDTEAVLALRNALDDAELDLLAEATSIFGPAGASVERIARHIMPMASRLTGLTLTRWDRD
ncbi:SCP2 sterol-binding domain-containing protein [Chelativorans sp. AA-79]|uniref:ubiquinone anaerobic biosynthesis accessory factor UbiT n=1 Tax=Chelativorans sp. AA-79 TaxID=3028735 RepID=UPI0023F69DA2|nr:SCP2 sterol-binding domain-containing protein [Chelativorans sp. AA-79]WEX08572.1 SCP2 sterol-binding domain-containing protein [Chelativorans sp. AA-79]